ncbi:hypothetical protein JTE90_005583 [Oedothorax gibbosus]|uniref:Uncharacterized protein n=1 Tax=Oedothorax gibbosus TaxID=931172 RepID=A0AAV6VAA4_9ARAC|nr:hypothetical protein JTE90_005583 [Oedothorax gibbosus]
MGNTHSYRASAHFKEVKESRPFASPENRVLPIPTQPQRLRSTDNGSILHNGGTISGRKAIAPPTDHPEFVRLLQKKNSFQKMHRKSHSDPDIVQRMMMDDDSDEEEEQNFSQRSIIAMSPSKAKIRSRKKKRAPEPPLSNTLPRTLNRYDDSPRSSYRSDEMPRTSYRNEEPSRASHRSNEASRASHRSNEASRASHRSNEPSRASYRINEPSRMSYRNDEPSKTSYRNEDTPRRPLPPIPLEEDTPPPDYNREEPRGKSYEKNRRTVDKWKFSNKQPDIPVPRPRCKSLDRSEAQHQVECADDRRERCPRNRSLRRASHTPSSSGNQKLGEEKTPEAILRDAIQEAAKKRSERLQRGLEYRNSSFKLSMESSKDISDNKNQAQTNPAECSQNSYKNPCKPIHNNVSDAYNSRYDDFENSSDKSLAENSNSYNFTRKNPVHKNALGNRKENRNYVPTKSHEKQSKIEYKRSTQGQTEPIKCNGKRSKWDSIIHDPILTPRADTAISISSTSTEELEIDLQLRPTLPRRPVELSRFSPTDVWKSINLDFFKSHQQRSDVSSDDAEDIMEEKICHINRPVAPRRLIHDRSGDSGIDAGSPMLLNESPDVLLLNNNNMCPSETILNEETLWVPQHDLADDSECGTDDSPLEQTTKMNMQAKLSMPNLMFPSRSLPRTDFKNGIEEVVISEREKFRGRRKKSLKNAEGQHFNSLRNLKKALGLRIKTSVDESKGLDPNWSLSRSLPNFINNLNVELTVAKPDDDEDPEMYVLDHIRRSNSESKAMFQEKMEAKLGHGHHGLHSEARNSFSCQTSKGHAIYLPEYRSSTTQLKGRRSADDEIRVNTDSELVLKRSFGNNRKRFSYQSTVRQEEKKKLEEKLAREAEARERKRQQEIEWMNKVEEEFRKQRDKEKVNIRHQLRILNLQEKSAPKNEVTEFADHFLNMKPNIHYGEISENKISSSSREEDPLKWQQPTGMKKWLKRQNRDCPIRPEPEGGRSSSDDCKDRNVNSNGYYNKRPTCIHDNPLPCTLCNTSYMTKSYNIAKKESHKAMDNTRSAPNFPLKEAKKNDGKKFTREQVYSKPAKHFHENGDRENGTPGRFESDEYELHTRLCRTNSGRTFESHSYYALERRQEIGPNIVRSKSADPKVFSTPNFQKELKENVRKKEKRSRKHTSCDYDSDDSGSDVRDARSQRPRRNAREPSFSRNHPHRNAARMKTNGPPNGRPSNIHPQHRIAT